MGIEERWKQQGCADGCVDALRRTQSMWVEIRYIAHIWLLEATRSIHMCARAAALPWPCRSPAREELANASLVTWGSW